jgi:succinate dehydrogenase hydrophobic anchor subunit
VIDVALLAFVLFHGLNGIRNIALDLGVKSGGDKAVTAVLTVIGLAAFAFGIAGLLAFRRYA